MKEVSVESAGGHSREHCYPRGSVGSFATVKSIDEQSIMTVEAHHKAADLFTVLLGNLNMLHRQPINEKGQRQLAWAEDATRQLCSLLAQGKLALLP